MFDPQTIREVYNNGKKIGIYSSSKIKSKNHIIAIFINIVKSPRVISSIGKDNAFRNGFKK